MVTSELDFIDKAHSRDHDKRKLVHDFYAKPFEQSYQDEMSFTLMDIKIQFRFIEKLPMKSLEYLKTKLGPFIDLSCEKKSDITVYYKQAPGELALLGSDLWNNPEFDYWVLEREELWDVIQRDFAAQSSKDMLTHYAIGPELCDWSSDTLDNLVAYVLPKMLLEKNALYLHCSTVVKNGKAYIFYGQSGAGKSTLANYCGHQEDLLVLGTDQTLVRWKDNKLYAQACTRKSPEFPRGDQNFSFDKYEVAGVLNLVQLGKYDFKKTTFEERLSSFIGESYFYVPACLKKDNFLQVACKIMNTDDVLYGKVSYPKNNPIWKAWQ